MNKKNLSQEVWIKPPKKISFDLIEIVQYKNLLWSYVRRDISVKYKQTLLGFLWVVLQPLVLMTIFVIFFSRMLRIPTDGVPPTVFYYSGLIIWTLFATSVVNASNSMVSNAEVIKKVYFPRLIIPLSSVFVAFFDYVISAGIYVIIVIGYYLFDPAFEFSISQFILCLPASIILAVVSSFGVGSTIAAWNVKFRDFRFIVPFMIQTLMFLTPVIYPVSILNAAPWLKYIFSINPMFSALNLARLPFMEVEIDIYMLLISTLSMCFLFIYGLYTFKKSERYFADLA